MRRRASRRSSAQGGGGPLDCPPPGGGLGDRERSPQSHVSAGSHSSSVRGIRVGYFFWQLHATEVLSIGSCAQRREGEGSGPLRYCVRGCFRRSGSRSGAMKAAGVRGFSFESVEPYSAAACPRQEGTVPTTFGFRSCVRCAYSSGPPRADYEHGSTYFRRQPASLNLRLSWRRAFHLWIAHASPHKRAVASSVRLWVSGALGGAGGGLRKARPA